MANVTQLAQRTIEAQAIHNLWRVLVERLGEEAALDMVGIASERSAHEAGRAFAATAPQGPSLAHFATILERWQAGDALEVEDVRLTATELTFRVTRCQYMGGYERAGIPPALWPRLSCVRDAAFARGYHPGLALERSQTIGLGDSQCVFRFVWGQAG